MIYQGGHVNIVKLKFCIGGYLDIAQPVGFFV
jgi:hypothetical protein